VLRLAVDCYADHPADEISKQFRAAVRYSQYDQRDCKNYNRKREERLSPAKRNLVVITFNDENIRFVRLFHGKFTSLLLLAPICSWETSQSANNKGDMRPYMHFSLSTNPTSQKGRQFRLTAYNTTFDTS